MFYTYCSTTCSSQDTVPSKNLSQFALISLKTWKKNAPRWRSGTSLKRRATSLHKLSNIRNPKNHISRFFMFFFFRIINRIVFGVDLQHYEIYQQTSRWITCQSRAQCSVAALALIIPGGPKGSQVPHSSLFWGRLHRCTAEAPCHASCHAPRQDSDESKNSLWYNLL